MKPLFRLISIVLSIFLCSFQLNAQLSPAGFDPAGELIPKSPEAAALIKFIDVPVSHYTGTPSIDVPITTIKEGNLEIPVSLSYHASGHRVDEYANWVGLGWKLNAGGMITRKIRGIADDTDTGLGFLSFRETYSYDNEDSQPSVHDWLINQDETKFQNLSSTCWDSQPDEFYFSFNGLSGKFAFDWTNGGDPIISSNQDVKIVSYTKASNSNEIIEWRLAGPDGTIYVFNELEKTIVYSMFSFFAPCTSGNHDYISGWHLTKVINPFYSSQYLELEYNNYTIQDDWTGFETRAYKMSYASACSGSISGWPSSSSSRVDILGKVLSRIKTSSNSFNLYLYANTARTDINQHFPSSPVLHRLDEITLKDRSNGVVSKHLMDYFSSGRLKLKSIQQKGKSNTLLPPYEFTYDSHSLPNTSSRSVDHWGFYNGSSNSTMLPAYIHYIFSGHVYFAGSNREPDLQYAQASILKTMKQPTGAVTEFDYELNDYGYISGQTVESQDQYEVNHEITGTTASNNSSTTNWVTQQVNFTINDNGTLVHVNISGKTYCTFLGHLYLPKSRIEDASGNIVGQWSLGVIDASQSSNPPIQNLADDLILDAGSYTLFCQAKKFIGSPSGDYITNNLSYDNVDLAAPLLEKNAGGVRVQEIRVKDINGELESVRRYEYDMADGRSSGVIYSEPRYVYTSANLTTNGQECNYVQLVGASRIVLGATSGSHIGYRKVTEFLGSNGENGKIEYEFTSPHEYGDILNFEKPFAPPKSNSFRTGLLDNKLYYKKSGSSYVLEKEENYDYYFKYYDINSVKVSYGRIAPPLYQGNILDLLLLGSAYASYPFYDKFAQSFTGMRIGHTQVKKVIEKTYFSGTPVSKFIEYQYDPNLHHATQTKTINSDGVEHISRALFPDGFGTGSNGWQAQGIAALNTKNIVNIPIEERQYIKEPGSSEKLKSAKLTLYKTFSGDPYPYEVWTSELSSPVTNFTPAYINGIGQLVKSSYYKNNAASAPDGQMTSYDSYGNLRRFNRYYDQYVSLIWGHNSSKPIAKAVNANTNEIAFTSFESGNSSQGGWSYSSSGVWSSSLAYGGKKHRYMNYGPISKSSVPAGKYLVSFWGRYLNASVKVNGTTVGSTSSSSSYKYYEFELNLTSTSTIQISGTGYIDELRLHPEDAMMTTYTFDHNSRLILAMGDENQVHNHYDYDEFYRLQTIKDHNKHITQSFEYNYQNGVGTDNSVKSRTVYLSGRTSVSQVNALSGANVNRSFKYLDGMGRVIQKVEVGQSPSQKDIISIQEYDLFGRESKQYLPYTYTTQNGSSKHTNVIARQNAFYYSIGGVPTSYGYTEQEYSSSPLNRILKERPPGEDFRTHPVEYTYRSNNSNEVRLFLNGNSTGYYPANTLFVKETEDENGNSVSIYTDHLDRLILTNHEGAKTYNVLNDFGQLEAVLPPQVVSEMTSSNNWNYLNTSYRDKIYYYTYDSRRRMLRKDVPGAEDTEYRYDRLDRIRAEMDGKMQSDGFKWKYIKYDILNRPVQTGIYSGAYPSVFHISGTLYETRNTSTHSYTNNSWPTTSASLRKVTFYDDYDLDGDNVADAWEQYLSPTASGYDSNNFPRVRDKETATKVGVLQQNGSTPTQWLYNQTFYDNKGHIIQTRNDNHLSQEDVNYYAYDFANRLTQSRKEHKASLSGTKTVNIDKEYQFDHAGRLLKTYQTVNGGSRILLVQNRYNERDLMIEKKLHKTTDGYFLQDVDYSYNIRGWMTAINSFACNNSIGPPVYSNQGPKGLSFKELRNAGLVLNLHGQQATIELQADAQSTDQQKSAPLQWKQSLSSKGSTVNQSLKIDLKDLVIHPDNLAQSLLTIEERIAKTIEEKGISNDPMLIAEKVQQYLEQNMAFDRVEAATTTPSSSTGIITGDSPDLFSLALKYEQGNSTLSAAAQYNGNISSMTWKVGCRDRQAYGFSYDTRNRITKAYYAEIDHVNGSYKNYNRYTMDIVQYDLNGNIKRLRRRGPISSSSYSYIDYLLYTYNGNELSSIRDYYYYRNKGFQAPASGYKSYVHDDGGNMTRDNHKNMDVEYNYLNLPRRINYDNGNWIEWTYNADGTKLKKETSSGAVKHYVGGVEYNGNCMEAVYHEEGRLTPIGNACLNTITNWQFEYTIRDHLGNARVSFADLNNDTDVDASEIIQENHYYPFGMDMEGSWTPTVGAENGYAYNDKELNKDFDLNWIDYGARWYDPAIGRWHSIDPLAADYTAISPYAYVANNPMIFLDPDGMRIRPFGDDALDLLLWGLTPEEAEYVRLDENGFVDAEYLRQGLEELGQVGGNYEALLEIAEAEGITEVLVAEGFTVINHQGEEQYVDFGEIDIQSEADMMWSLEKDAYEAQGITKEEYLKTHNYSTEIDRSGFFGVTLYGELAADGGGYGKTTTGNTQVVLNNRAPDGVQTEFHAHENYGHNYFKTIGKNSSHGEIKSLSSDDPRNNKELEIQIHSRMNEAKVNYEKHH